MPCIFHYMPPLVVDGTMLARKKQKGFISWNGYHALRNLLSV